MSSFIAIKLDENRLPSDNSRMTTRSLPKPRNVAATVRQRIEQGGERLWRLEDFSHLPFMAVAQSLSRLTREGVIQRLSKGVYYRARQTSFGTSRPNPAAIQNLASRRKKRISFRRHGGQSPGIHHAECQEPRRSPPAPLSLPRKLIGQDTVIHTRRPEAWADLPETDAALLDFLQTRAVERAVIQRNDPSAALALLSETGPIRASAQSR